MSKNSVIFSHFDQIWHSYDVISVYVRVRVRLRLVQNCSPILQFLTDFKIVELILIGRICSLPIYQLQFIHKWYYSCKESGKADKNLLGIATDGCHGNGHFGSYHWNAKVGRFRLLIVGVWRPSMPKMLLSAPIARFCHKSTWLLQMIPTSLQMIHTSFL